LNWDLEDKDRPQGSQLDKSLGGIFPSGTAWNSGNHGIEPTKNSANQVSAICRFW
jgi:hypothetical protein